MIPKYPFIVEYLVKLGSTGQNRLHRHNEETLPLALATYNQALKIKGLISAKILMVIEQNTKGVKMGATMEDFCNDLRTAQQLPQGRRRSCVP